VSSNALSTVLQPLEATCHPILHDTYEDFHHSVFGLPTIHRSRQRKVVNLLAREGHPALTGKRARYATKSNKMKSDRHLPTMQSKRKGAPAEEVKKGKKKIKEEHPSKRSSRRREEQHAFI